MQNLVGRTGNTEHYVLQVLIHFNALAESLGVNDYGMHQYLMAYLKTGPNRDRNPEEAAKLPVASFQ